MSSPEAESQNELHLSLTMVNRRGLHARAAAKFVKIAERYDCEIEVSKDGQSVSGRSIMGLLMLAAIPGSIIEVRLKGDEAAAAAEEIATLVASGFGEED